MRGEKDDDQRGRLFEAAALRADSDLPAWLIAEYQSLWTELMDPNFPCYFGTNAAHRGHLRFTYLRRDVVGQDCNHLPATLSAFVELSRSNPTNPEDPLFEFCFAGDPMFVFGCAPAYAKRRSRNVGKSLVVFFQPRRVFAGIEGGTPAGNAVRRRIREKLILWDGLDPHPDMRDYGDPKNNEWKQYWITEENAPIMGKCPFRARSKE